MSKGEEALGAERDIELVIRVVSGGMAFVLEGHLRGDCSDERELVFIIHVWTNADRLQRIVKPFEKLPSSVLIVPKRLQPPVWTAWKAATTEFAEDDFAESMQCYSAAY